MNEVIPQKVELPAELAGMDIFQPDASADDFVGGIVSSFPIISIRGSKWLVKSGGEEKPILDEEGIPVAALKAVLVKGLPTLSKTYYAEGFSEEASETPTCASLDSVHPDAGIETPQAQSCAACKFNQFGSDPVTGRGKACRDHKRMVVLAANDLKAPPMLMRVPVMSLSNLQEYVNRLRAQGLTGASVETIMSFDPQAAYPRIQFRATKVLDNNQKAQVGVHYHNGTVDNILSMGVAPKADPVPDQEAPAPVKTMEEEADEAAAAKKKATAEKRAATRAANKAAKEAKEAKEAAEAAEAAATKGNGEEAPASADDPAHSENTSDILATLEGLDSVA